MSPQTEPTSAAPAPNDAASPEGEDTAAPMGLRERNKADKWRRIVDAASRLFASRGFEATTTAAIAEEAGIGTGTLYLYVTSKEDLLLAVFRDEVGELWDNAFALIAPDAPVVEQLMTAFSHVTAYHEQEPELTRIYFKELMFVSPAMRSGVSQFMREFIARFAELLDKAKVNGLLDPEVPTGTLAHNLWAQYYILMQRRYAGSLEAESLLPRLERSFQVALWGVTRP